MRGKKKEIYGILVEAQVNKYKTRVHLHKKIYVNDGGYLRTIKFQIILTFLNYVDLSQ